ncbi:MAG: 16S rRNA (guanine(527)-N(7))-methyltransferase RsmG [Anaerolineaceae bacterium]|nr:16S rRNA (guanine(527)-N(7))-methyltransferase RsmG [Anaerolineaceae bacterium]
MELDTLRNEAMRVFNLKLSQKQLDQIAYYERLLIEWNEKINLTAITDVDDIRKKHFLDSLSTVALVKKHPPKRLVDVGTGAGFPGLVIKIMLPEMQLTLVESVGKKVTFCQMVADELGLENVSALSIRAEDLGRDAAHREQYDWAVARAVANLPTLVEYLLPLVRVGGKVLAQKGETGPAEAQKAEKAIKLLGGHLDRLHHITLPGVVEERYLVEINKVAITPNKYPRRVGIPSKKPLL